MDQKNENSTKIIERLSQFIDYKNENFTQLGIKIGVSNSYFSKMVRNGGSIGTEIISKIVKYYDDLSADWLLTGQGDMLRSSQKIGDVSNSTVVGANVNGNGNTIQHNSPETIVEREKNYNEIIKKQQEQIDRLIEVINKLSNK